MRDVETEIGTSLRKHVVVAAIGCLMLIAGVGGWSLVTEISGAVIAQGLLVVDSNAKKVQHPTGGVVAELAARDGNVVRAGDVLVRLDDTQMRANLAVVTKSLDELSARGSRERAEQQGRDGIDFTADLLGRSDEPEVAKLMAGECRLFEVRRAARDGQKAQLTEEIRGLEVQRDARVQQIDWIHKELEGVTELWKTNLVPYSRLTALEREAARLEGERGQFISAIAQAHAKILQIDQDLRAETGKDLAEIRAKRAELVERKVAAEDQLKRVDIRAPRDGIVFQSTVHTVGGVIAAGELIMLVAPAGERLMVEAKLRPQDIDQVQAGSEAAVRFSAFDTRTTPEVKGTVSLVSPDVAQDQKTGAYYYTARISVADEEVAKLGDLKLVPGMPVEAFVRTSGRTAISYLMRPLHDQIARAFREK